MTNLLGKKVALVEISQFEGEEKERVKTTEGVCCGIIGDVETRILVEVVTAQGRRLIEWKLWEYRASRGAEPLSKYESFIIVTN